MIIQIAIALSSLASAFASIVSADQLIITTSSSAESTIWVNSVPTSVRAYAIAHYDAGGCLVGQQMYRFPVTGTSSNNAFTLVTTNAPASTDLGVLPHFHQVHYENFFNYRGRFQLWSNKDGADTTRILNPGDFGAIPQNATHTFQILDPDTEMLGIIQPGGFEDLFYSLGQANFTSPISSPYDSSINSSTGSPPPEVIEKLTFFDVYAQLQYQPGPVPANTTWHSTANALAADAVTPYMVAKDFGPKYLVESNGYQIVQPLVTPIQSAGNFSLSTITLSKATGQAIKSTFIGHAAFEVLEGNLKVSICNETVSLLQGDVVFIPSNTSFSYFSDITYTKALFIAQGSEGLDTNLIASGSSWDSPVWPLDKVSI